MTSSPIVYVDVDDTLVRSFGTKRIPIASMVTLVRGLKELGAEMYCWSASGSAYAREIAREVGLEDCFAAFLPKPHMLLSDVDLPKWKIVQLHPVQCNGLSAAEVLAKLAG